MSTSFNVLIVGIVALLVGIAFCFAGYRFFRFLIAIWGFLTGFLLTAQAFSNGSEGHLLLSPLGLIIAVIVGLVLAALAYYLYVAAVVILGASVGFWVGTGLVAAVGFGSHSALALLVGIICAIVLAILTLTLNLTRLLIIIGTALGGASAIVAGVLLFLGIIRLDALSSGIVGAIISGSRQWSLVWLILAAVGIIVQMSRSQSYMPGYARSQY
jgi:hypothetical protein